MPDRIVSADVIVCSPGRNFVTLKITTADGVVGWGDATVNGRELSVASYLRDHVAPLLLGRDPQRIEDTWQYLYRGAYWRRGPITMAAIGAVDLALWDIAGKIAGQPVFNLLGGAVRDRILCYTHANGTELPEVLDAVDAKRAAGFVAVRAQFGVPGLDQVYGVHAPEGIDDDHGAGAGHGGYEPAGRGARPVEEVWDTGAYLRHAPATLAAVRDHVGPELKLLHDAHHRLRPVEAARLARELEPADLFWLEDVTPAENQQVLRLVREHSTTPLAIGEVFNTIWDCQQLIIEQQIDYIRACVMHAGGISHARRIWDLAALYQVLAGPHGPSDVSPITMAASLHLALATPNFGIQEYMGYEPVTEEVFGHGWSFTDGYLHPGDAPGLGVTVDEEAAAAHPYQPAYLPVARTRDGAITNW
ncbi:mannonate dehydratase [Friedmanniella endophytica]|uniref:Mannonate dehydratase n=1 Tax=Microlunatus kandeliicorticis TaxID=1759536 RepID=A0A7W3IVF5_9ACTN|nr:D-mannonate dehydratase ManD [Microlunatus kandeliicorticis]MBA8795905.1 mannonate dehydratase [Microlunatus kandeliicorticis]